MNQHKVQLYKIRDFGAKINVTFEYIRHNLLPLLKVVLLIVAPVALLFGILFSNMFSTMFEFAANQDTMNPDPFGMMSALGTNYILMMLVSLLTISLLLSVIYGYMKLNDGQEDKPTPGEVFKLILPRLPMAMVLILMISVVCMIGFVLFFIPGLYLMITLSLAVPIYIFENEGVGEAFSKSFKLISGKWWSTFGILFITGIIATIVSYVFFIPMYALMALAAGTESGTNDPEAALAIFSSWYSIVGMALVMIGSYITYMVPIIGLAFQYFNLSERLEGRGIRNQINEFEKA